MLCGNIGSPVLDVLAEPAELLAVELSSFQLHWAPSLRPEAGVVLNVAEDHLDWHGSMAHYAAAKARALTGRVARRRRSTIRSPRGCSTTPPAPVRVGFRLGEPGRGRAGCARRHAASTAPSPDGGWSLADRGVDPGARAGRRARRARPRPRWPGRSTCPPSAIADGAGVVPGRAGTAPRWSRVVDGVTYVDDSKATNPHAAQASIAGLPAGGVDGRRSAQGRIGRRTGAPRWRIAWSGRC